MSTPAKLVETTMNTIPDLTTYGIHDTAEVIYNPSFDTLLPTASELPEKSSKSTTS